MARNPRNENIGERGAGQQREEEQEAAIWIAVGEDGAAQPPAERLYVVIAPQRHITPRFIVRTSAEADAVIIGKKMSGPEIRELKRKALNKACIAETALMGALRTVKIGRVCDLDPEMQGWAVFEVGKRRRVWFRIKRDPSKHNPREYVIFPHDPSGGPDHAVDGGPKGKSNGAAGGGNRGGGARRDGGAAGDKRRQRPGGPRSALILYKFARISAGRWISAARAEIWSRSKNSLALLRRAASHVVRVLYNLDATINDLAENYARRMSRVHGKFTHGAQLPVEGVGSRAMLKPRLVGDRIGLPLLLFSFAQSEEIDWGAYLFGVDWNQNIFGARAEEGPMAA